MGKIEVWAYILASVFLALCANTISAIWASKENKFMTGWFLLLLVISPFVFITFGLVTAKLGLSVSSGTIDSLLTISTILVGLFLFHEISNISIYQGLGMAFAFFGIILMQFHR